jgi:hypothetical protein
MADFNINLKYKGATGGAGKGAGSKSSGTAGGLDREIAKTRDKAVKESKKEENKGAFTKDTAKKLVDSNLKLTSTLTKLIQSNAQLLKALERAAGIHGGGSGTPAPAGPPLKDETQKKVFKGSMYGTAVGNAMSRAPGTIGDTISFALQKIHQIGTAYMEETGKQKRSSGVGGFRYGGNHFYGEELSSGMKSFGEATGQFQSRAKYHKQGEYNYTNEKGKKVNWGKAGYHMVNSDINQSALKMGNIFGLGAEEPLHQAGVFKRSGNEENFKKSMNIGAGHGIEAELPLFMTALSDSLEEAMKNGIDASEMNSKMGEQLAVLTKYSNNNVESALRTAKAFSGTKEGMAKGQVTDLKGLLAWKGAQKSVLDEMNDETIVDKKTGKTKRDVYFEKRVEAGDITEDEAKQYKGKKNINFQDIERISGGRGAWLIQQRSQEMTNMDIMKSVYAGKGKTLDHRSFGQMLGEDPAQWAIVRKYSENKGGVPDAEKKGEGILKAQYKGYESQGSTWGTDFGIQKQNAVIANGYQFAEALQKMETTMLKLAVTSMPAVTLALKGFTATVDGIGYVIENHKEAWKNVKSKAQDIKDSLFGK